MINPSSSGYPFREIRKMPPRRERVHPRKRTRSKIGFETRLVPAEPWRKESSPNVRQRMEDQGEHDPLVVINEELRKLEQEIVVLRATDRALWELVRGMVESKTKNKVLRELEQEVVGFRVENQALREEIARKRQYIPLPLLRPSSSMARIEPRSQAWPVSRIYRRKHLGKCRSTQEGCYRCGQPRHFIKDCLQGAT